MESLKKEHVRITATMQSFERMLDRVQKDAKETNTVSQQYLNDLNGFIKFCRGYSMHHHNKEELMFDVAKSKENAPLLQDTVKEHDKGRELYQLMQNYSDDMSKKSNKDRDDVNNLDNVIIPSKTYIHLLYDHIEKEDCIIYPTCEFKLDESEMEQLSQKFDDLDYQNADVINAMEFLSDELNEKYKV